MGWDTGGGEYNIVWEGAVGDILLAGCRTKNRDCFVCFFRCCRPGIPLGWWSRRAVALHCSSIYSLHLFPDGNSCVRACVRLSAYSSAELPFRMLCFCSNFVFCARVSRRSTWREEELKKIGFELEVSKQKKHSVGLPTTLYCRRKLPMLSRR